MQSYIILNGIRFYAYHGVGEQEMLVGNEFSIDLRLKTDVARAAETDNVEDTVNYADVFTSIRDEMNHPSKLLEHVANRIVHRLFKDFPAIEEVELKLLKRNPPMEADIESAGIELHCTRMDSRL